MQTNEGTLAGSISFGLSSVCVWLVFDELHFSSQQGHYSKCAVLGRPLLDDLTACGFSCFRNCLTTFKREYCQLKSCHRLLTSVSLKPTVILC